MHGASFTFNQRIDLCRQIGSTHVGNPYIGISQWLHQRYAALSSSGIVAAAAHHDTGHLLNAKQLVSNILPVPASSGAIWRIYSCSTITDDLNHGPYAK